MSETNLQLAKKLSKNNKINYFKDNINNLTKIKSDSYDAIFNVGVLHHSFRLSKTLWNLNKALKNNGLMFNFKYIGPAYNQYSDKHLEIMKQINNDLPSRFQTILPLKPKIKNFVKGDPSEAVNVDLVYPTILRFFDIVYEKKSMVALLIKYYGIILMNSRKKIVKPKKQLNIL